MSKIELEEYVTTLEAENKKLREDIKHTKEVLVELHEPFFACTKLQNCHTTRQLKKVFQKFRDLMGADEADQRERKWR